MKFPYITFFFIIILIVIQCYRDNLKPTYCNMNDEVQILNLKIKKYFTTHLIHAGSFWGHFIPNIILTLFLGSILEWLVGSIKLFIYIFCSIFIYWPLMYIFIKTYREGCGFSSIYFSFVSIYFSLIAIYEKKLLYRIIFVFIPYLFLFIINYTGRAFAGSGHSTNGIHILSIIYGYIVGIIELLIRR